MPSSLQLYLTPKAEEDFELIYYYSYSEWGLEQAEIYQNTLFLGMKQLELYPQMGSTYVNAKAEYRTLVIKKHIVFYRVEASRIVVVRIIHGSMDRKKWMN